MATTVNLTPHIGYYARQDWFTTWSACYHDDVGNEYDITYPLNGVGRGLVSVVSCLCGAIKRCMSDRFLFKFDTSGIPEGAVISEVIWTGYYDYYSGFGPYECCDNPLSGHVLFLRAPDPEAYLPVGAEKHGLCGYLRDLGILIGGVYVPSSADGKGEIPFEITFNDAGIASIVKGGATYIGLKCQFDTISGPPDNHFQWIRIGITGLSITYGEASDLTVITLPATGVTKNSVTINGGITAGAATKRGFDYGEGGELLINEWYEEGTYGIGEFSHDLTDLTPGQNFCHRAKAC